MVSGIDEPQEIIVVRQEDELMSTAVGEEALIAGTGEVGPPDRLDI